MSINISSKLISKLGSENSKIPLAVKDIVNCSGYAYYSYDAGGKLECKDRLVDEIGTGTIWLFGIPAYKKLIDKTIYKLAKISPEVDIRILKNKDIYQLAKANAPTKEIFNDLQNVAKNTKLTKELAIIKFGLSLGLTMLSYLGLTKFKQNMTKKNIEKEFLRDQEINKEKTNIFFPGKPDKIFSDFEEISIKARKNPSFGNGLIKKVAEEYMLNPIKNMMILDLGISGQRLASSRTEGEFREYAIKEGSFLFFVYGAGEFIKKGINKFSEKILKSPIELDAKLLNSKLMERILKEDEIKKEINKFKEFLKNNRKEEEIYEYLIKNQNTAIVKSAQISGIINTVKDKSGRIQIDTRKYIDINEIRKLTESIEKIIESGEKKNIEKYLNKIKMLKAGSTIINVGICCLTLGHIVPKYMYKIRANNQNGDKGFHVKEEYEKELAKKSLQKPLKN